MCSYGKNHAFLPSPMIKMDQDLHDLLLCFLVSEQLMKFTDITSESKGIRLSDSNSESFVESGSFADSSSFFCCSSHHSKCGSGAEDTKFLKIKFKLIILRRESSLMPLVSFQRCCTLLLVYRRKSCKLIESAPPEML